MKTIRSLVLLSLAIPISLSTAPADEENPFLNSSANKAPASAAGDSFLTLTEHLLVPSDILDSWLATHSMAKDASELRAAAQQWIEEGKATIESSALTPGVVGRQYSNESLVEQIYATEYEPAPSPEDWVTPTSFETRNCGYTILGDAVREQGELIVRESPRYVRMLPHRSFDQVSEKTRQPDDVFIPRFRSFSIQQALSAPDGQFYSDDPFASSSPPPHRRSIPSYPEGKTHLILRIDDDLAEPVIKRPDGNKPEKDEAPPSRPDRPVRLVFIRSDKTDSPPENVPPLPENPQFSAKLISVDHRTLSDWLQGRDLATASRELGAAVEQWNEDDKVTLISSMSGGVVHQSRTLLEDIKKLEYPTEYEPGKPEPTADGKSTQLGFSTGSNPSSRNVGTSLIARISSDDGTQLLSVQLYRVLLGCYTVHHRVLRDGEWVQDITFPRFSSNLWETSVRPKKGEWMLVGGGSDFAEKGKLDPTRAVLAFVKVD